MVHLVLVHDLDLAIVRAYHPFPSVPSCSYSSPFPFPYSVLAPAPELDLDPGSSCSCPAAFPFPYPYPYPYPFQEASSFHPVLAPVIVLVQRPVLDSDQVAHREKHYQVSYPLRALLLIVVDVVAYTSVEPFEQCLDPSFACLVVVEYLVCSLGRCFGGMLGSSCQWVWV